MPKMWIVVFIFLSRMWAACFELIQENSVLRNFPTALSAFRMTAWGLSFSSSENLKVGWIRFGLNLIISSLKKGREPNFVKVVLQKEVFPLSIFCFWGVLKNHSPGFFCWLCWKSWAPAYSGKSESGSQSGASQVRFHTEQSQVQVQIDVRYKWVRV